MKFKHLFEPYTLRGVTLKNRLISAPCERNYANTDGSVTQGTSTTWWKGPREASV